MHQARLPILIFAILAAIAPPRTTLACEYTLTDTADFTIIKRSGGITLYERWYSFGPRQFAREIKATFNVRATPAAAVNLIKDELRGKKWNHNSDSYKVVDSELNTWICYIQYDLPWPVNNQDCVLQYHHYDSAGRLVIDFKGIDHTLFPIKNRVQRIAEISGRWIFSETAEGTIVDYYITTTQSKTLPGWLTDPIIRKNLIETMDSFRKILENDL